MGKTLTPKNLTDRELRELGERAALGVDIEDLYKKYVINEAAREQFEIGYRGADAELRQEGH